MKKHTKSLLFTLASVTACALSACGKKKNKPGEIEFWSSFGSAYTSAVDNIVAIAEQKTGVKVTHLSKGNYDQILEKMIPAINVGKQPNLAIGYPDHFATYLADDSLMPIDDYMTEEILNDYYPEYMKENYFTAYNEKNLYALPFNKSTEVLGYNGTFVAYCATKDESLGTIPKTWAEWEVQGPKYLAIYDDLIDNSFVLYGKQHNDGSAYDLVAKAKENNVKDDEGDIHDAAGRVGLIDFGAIHDKKENTRLISWDATDNAFITLCRQWGAEYTDLDLKKNNQGSMGVNFQKGDVLFGSSTNMPKVVDFLKFFTNLSRKRIFGVPAELNGQYSSDAFQDGSVMFMICSSGGLSYNTKTWHNDFTVAPIPYKDENHKFVISQGANICMTDKGNYDDCFKVMRELTTGDTQAEWCLSTGYYPSTKSATNSAKYQTFLHEAEPAVMQKYVNDWNAKPENASKQMTLDDREKQVYGNPNRSAFREGSMVNEKYYMGEGSTWHKFVDDAFNGSSGVRKAVKNALKIVFTNAKASGADITSSKFYEDIINQYVLGSADISNVNIVR